MVSSNWTKTCRKLKFSTFLCRRKEHNQNKIMIHEQCMPAFHCRWKDQTIFHFQNNWTQLIYELKDCIILSTNTEFSDKQLTKMCEFPAFKHIFEGLLILFILKLINLMNLYVVCSCICLATYCYILLGTKKFPSLFCFLQQLFLATL